MNEKTFWTTLAILLIFTIFALGWLGNELYRNNQEQKEYQREFNGFYFENWNYTDVENYTDDNEARGDWICVNIRGMTFEEAFDTCKHETGHEIFAEYCSKDEENFERCLGVVKNEQT